MFYVRDIHFDNPALFQHARPIALGDTLLLGVKGIWKVTTYHAGSYWAGGLKLSIKKGEVFNRIYRPEFLAWLASLYKGLTVGQRVVGHQDDGERHYGVITESLSPTDATLWVRADDGYTRPLNVGTVRVLPPERARLELRTDRVGFNSPEYARRIAGVQKSVESLLSKVRA